MEKNTVLNLRCVLYQPDIPQNTGSVIRTATCFGVGMDLVEPMGFVWDEKRIRRAGMDYLEHADVVRHASWQAYRTTQPADSRLVLLTTQGAERLDEFRFQPGDRLLFGRESAGVPPDVHQAADARVIIPMVPAMRSINVAVSVGIVMAEALRQLDAWPKSR